MHALLLTQDQCGCVDLLILSPFEAQDVGGYAHGSEEVSATVLGFYPTKPLAEQVKARLEQMFTTHPIRTYGGGSRLVLDPKAIVDYMRKHTPPVRMSRREAKRTRATIAAALEIIDDEAQRRKLMPF